MKKFRLTLKIEGEDESRFIPCCDVEADSIDDAYVQIQSDFDKAMIYRAYQQCLKHDMYYCPTCKKVLDITEIDSCMNTPNEIVDYCLQCKGQVINLEEYNKSAI